MFRFCGKSMRLACKFYDPLLLRYFGSNSDMLLLTYFNIVTLPNGKIKVGFKINRYIYPLFYTNYLFLKEDKKKDLFRWIYFVLVYYPPFSVRTTFGEFHMLRKKKKKTDVAKIGEGTRGIFYRLQCIRCTPICIGFRGVFLMAWFTVCF